MVIAMQRQRQHSSLCPNLTEPQTVKQDLGCFPLDRWGLFWVCVCQPLLSKFIPFLFNPSVKKKKIYINYWPESSEVVCSCWLIKAIKMTTPMSVIKCVKLTNEKNKDIFSLLVMLWHQFVLNNESENLVDLLFIMVQISIQLLIQNRFAKSYHYQ